MNYVKHLLHFGFLYYTYMLSHKIKMIQLYLNNKILYSIENHHYERHSSQTIQYLEIPSAEVIYNCGIHN